MLCLCFIVFLLFEFVEFFEFDEFVFELITQSTRYVAFCWTAVNFQKYTLAVLSVFVISIFFHSQNFCFLKKLKLFQKNDDNFSKKTKSRFPLGLDLRHFRLPQLGTGGRAHTESCGKQMVVHKTL